MLMKKRNIISGLLTILILSLTCKQWLVFKPLPVSFLAKGNGDYVFTVQLNKKDNSEFKKVKECVIRKHLSGGFEKCECQINRGHSPKRLRILAVSKSTEPLEIKSIELRNGKFKLPDDSIQITHGGGGDA